MKVWSRSRVTKLRAFEFFSVKSLLLSLLVISHFHSKTALAQFKLCFDLSSHTFSSRVLWCRECSVLYSPCRVSLCCSLDMLKKFLNITTTQKYVMIINTCGLLWTNSAACNKYKSAFPTLHKYERFRTRRFEKKKGAYWRHEFRRPIGAADARTNFFNIKRAMKEP